MSVDLNPSSEEDDVEDFVQPMGRVFINLDSSDDEVETKKNHLCGTPGCQLISNHKGLCSIKDVTCDRKSVFKTPIPWHVPRDKDCEGKRQKYRGATTDCSGEARSFLASIGLSCYADKLVSEGFDDMEFLSGVDPYSLEKACRNSEMKELHISKLFYNLKIRRPNRKQKTRKSRLLKEFTNELISSFTAGIAKGDCSEKDLKFGKADLWGMLKNYCHSHRKKLPSKSNFFSEFNRNKSVKRDTWWSANTKIRGWRIIGDTGYWSTNGP